MAEVVENHAGIFALHSANFLLSLYLIDSRFNALRVFDSNTEYDT